VGAAVLDVAVEGVMWEEHAGHVAVDLCARPPRRPRLKSAR
jgi:hypothetical protein